MYESIITRCLCWCTVYRRRRFVCCRPFDPSVGRSVGRWLCLESVMCVVRTNDISIGPTGFYRAPVGSKATGFQSTSIVTQSEVPGKCSTQSWIWVQFRLKQGPKRITHVCIYINLSRTDACVGRMLDACSWQCRMIHTKMYHNIEIEKRISPKYR